MHAHKLSPGHPTIIILPLITNPPIMVHDSSLDNLSTTVEGVQ